MKNVGRLDASFRVVLGFVIIVLGLSLKSWWAVIGLVPIITASINFCPLYSIFRINTRKHEEATK